MGMSQLVEMPHQGFRYLRPTLYCSKCRKFIIRYSAQVHRYFMFEFRFSCLRLRERLMFSALLFRVIMQLRGFRGVLVSEIWLLVIYKQVHIAFKVALRISFCGCSFSLFTSIFPSFRTMGASTRIFFNNHGCNCTHCTPANSGPCRAVAHHLNYLAKICHV